MAKKVKNIKSAKSVAKLDWRGIAAILFFLVGVIILIAVLATEGTFFGDYEYEFFIGVSSIVTGIAVFSYERRWIEFFLMFLCQVFSLCMIAGMSVIVPKFYILFAINLIFTIVLCMTNKNRR